MYGFTSLSGLAANGTPQLSISLNLNGVEFSGMLEANTPVPVIPTVDIPSTLPARKKTSKKVPTISTTSGAFEAENCIHKENSLEVASEVHREVSKEKDSPDVIANEGVNIATAASEQKSIANDLECKEMVSSISYISDGVKNCQKTASEAPAKNRQLDSEKLTTRDGEDLAPAINHIDSAQANEGLVNGSADASTLKEVLFTS